MNSLFDSPSLPPMALDSPARADAELAIESYIDLLSANLLGRISTEERCRQKDEARFHVERLAAHYESQGKGPVEAAREAVRKYGDPAILADDMVARSYEQEIRSRLFRSVGRGNVTAFAIVGLAQLLFIFCLQTRIFSPDSSPYSMTLDPGDLRQIFPSPLPLPQQPSDVWLLYILPVLAPFVIGWVAGQRIPVRPGRAVAGAMMVGVLYSFAVAVSLLPRTEMLTLAAFQLAWWIPVGSMCSELSLGLRIWRTARKGPDGLT